MRGGVRLPVRRRTRLPVVRSAAPGEGVLNFGGGACKGPRYARASISLPSLPTGGSGRLAPSGGSCSLGGREGSEAPHKGPRARFQPVGLVVVGSSWGVHRMLTGRSIGRISTRGLLSRARAGCVPRSAPDSHRGRLCGRAGWACRVPPLSSRVEGQHPPAGHSKRAVALTHVHHTVEGGAALVSQVAEYLRVS